MNIYNAIMHAADFIESTPDRFDYMACGVPRADHCGSPGCALGWIGAMAGLADPHEKIGGIALVAGHGYGDDENGSKRSLLGIDQSDFYIRMEGFDKDWNASAYNCARALRLYADEYHSSEKTPNWRALASKWIVGDDVKSQELVS